jgi:hypothetical protein
MARIIGAERAEALAKGSQTYDTGKPCKHGHFSPRYVSTHACIECQKAIGQAWAQANAEKMRQSNKKQYTKSPDKTNARYAKRRAAKKQATPKWVGEGELFFLQEAYALAKEREKIFGFKWEVDHIVPLNSKVVCGLHVPKNLRVVPHMVNRIKGNKFLTEEMSSFPL